MARVPASVKDLIDEEPDRLLAYLDLERIFKSENPYETFLEEFERAFNKKGGINLWMYLQDNYFYLNKLFKDATIQNRLSDEFKGAIPRKEVSEFQEEYKDRVEEVDEEREVVRKRPVKVTYVKKGKKITYSRAKPTDYSDRQNRFILARQDYTSNARLASEFNIAFGKNISKFALRDHKYRLLGKKK